MLSEPIQLYNIQYIWEVFNTSEKYPPNITSRNYIIFNISEKYSILLRSIRLSELLGNNPARQYCKTKQLQDQTILETAACPDPETSTPKQSGNRCMPRPGTQSCYNFADNSARQNSCMTRQSCKTILQDTCFERLKFSQLNTAYSQTHGLIITDSPAWLQVGRFRNGLKRLRIKADILQL